MVEYTSQHGAGFSFIVSVYIYLHIHYTFLLQIEMCGVQNYLS